MERLLQRKSSPQMEALVECFSKKFYDRAEERELKNIIQEFVALAEDWFTLRFTKKPSRRMVFRSTNLAGIMAVPSKVSFYFESGTLGNQYVILFWLSGSSPLVSATRWQQARAGCQPYDHCNYNILVSLRLSDFVTSGCFCRRNYIFDRWVKNLVPSYYFLAWGPAAYNRTAGCRGPINGCGGYRRSFS